MRCNMNILSTGKIFRGVRLLLVLATASLTACHSIAHDAAHTSRNALDWVGTYSGITPCADCEGIRTTVTLSQDGNFTRQRVYLGRSHAPQLDAGSFSWSASGNAVTLAASSESTQQFQVAENRLIQLDREGNRIKGDLADRYVLAKAIRDAGIEDQRWLLSELMGTTAQQGDEFREAYIEFDSAQGQATGNTSCNSFSGSYVLLHGGRIHFTGGFATTKMACPEMTVESGFLAALSRIDNYSVSGDKLSLNRARMAPLLVFERFADVN